MTFFDLRESFRRHFRPSQLEKVRALESRELELGEREKLINMRLKLAEKESELAEKEKLIVTKTPVKPKNNFMQMLGALTQSSNKANQDFKKQNLTTVNNQYLAECQARSEDVLGLKSYQNKKVKLI